MSLETIAGDILYAEPVFNLMRATVENGPFHREANVLTHTMMVCDWYESNVSVDNDWRGLGLMACLLHDIGKPACLIKKYIPERGEYLSFVGHDYASKLMAEEMLVRYGASEFDIYRICWMIEHHQVIWSAKAPARREMARVLKSRDFYEPFKMFMIADDMGRICDSRNIDCRS